jgi:hypothetical protein
VDLSAGERRRRRPYIAALLPEHSRKCTRDTIGYRESASTVKVSGRFTMPWINTRWVAGSMSGTPLWCRSK